MKPQGSSDYYQSLDLVDMPCGLCGYDRPKRLFQVDRYDMGTTTVACPKCGLIFINPRPSDEALREFYANHYRGFYFGVDEPTPDQIAESTGGTRAQLVREVLQNRRLIREGTRVIDAGCGAGELLKELHATLDLGPSQGIEPGEAFGRFAQQHAGCPVHLGTLRSFIDDHEAATPRFDLVILSHVLEHLTEPLEHLKTVRQLVSDSGHLYVEVPNIAAKSGKRQQFHLAHLYYFFPETLDAVLRRAGWEPVELITTGLADRWAMAIIAEAGEPQPDAMPDARAARRQVAFVRRKILGNWRKRLKGAVLRRTYRDTKAGSA